ncbi:MAG TPA: hypothetical protein VGJ54_07085, partial [Streptosporangiaceae bacterium]
LAAELFANAFINAAATGEALERAQSRLASPSTSSAWRVNSAMIAAAAAQPPGDALGHLTPVLAEGLRDVPPDSLTAVYALLVLIWSGELATAGDICEAVLSAARGRGSMSMVAHASCLRSMIMRRLGRFDDAAADASLALDFKLATSPPLAVAWAAGLCIEPLTRLGRLGEADAIAAAAAGREPPPGWIHTLTFLQARGALRVAQRRHAEALEDLLAAGTGWRALGIDNPAAASWRTAAAAAHAALGHQQEAAELAAEQLTLARQVGTPVTLGTALRAYTTAADAGHPAHPGRSGRSGQSAAGESLAEAVGLLESTPARYELALALADLGPSCAGQDGAPTPGSRSAAPWIWRSAPVPRRWPSGPGGSCSRPGPGPGAPPLPALTRSPAPNGGSPASLRTACPTGRSPSTFSSPSPPSKPTFGTPSTSSASPPGPTCRRSWIVNSLQ